MQRSYSKACKPYFNGIKAIKSKFTGSNIKYKSTEGIIIKPTIGVTSKLAIIE
jgi:hypothetical protein